LIDPNPDRFLTDRIPIFISINCRTKQALLLIILLGAVLTKPAQLCSQVRFGVQWNPPEDTAEFNRQLTVLHSLGISKLQLVPPLSQRQINSIENFDSQFQLSINPPLSFLIDNDSGITQAYLTDTLSRFVRKFQPHQQVTAIGLLDRSELYNDDFARKFLSVAKNLANLTDKKLFITTAFPLSEECGSNPLPKISDSILIDIQLVVSDATDINSEESFFSYLYVPENKSTFNQRQFRSILNSLLKKDKIPTLFLTGSWLSERLVPQDSKIDFAELIKRYQHDDKATFMINDEPQSRHSEPLDWTVFLLIIIFGSFAFHYSYSSIYRNCLFRYFRTHMFFVEDVFKRRIRTSITGYVILIQHILATCIMFYLLSVSVFNETGWQVILHHFPALTPLYDTLPLIIIPTALLALTVELFIILLIYLTNKSVKHLNQVFLLYCWPLQIGTVIAAIALILDLKDYPSYLLLILAVFFVINWIGSIIISIVDLSIFTKESKTLFITINGGFILFTLGFLVYIIATRNLLDIVWLAFKLSGA